MEYLFVIGICAMVYFFWQWGKKKQAEQIRRNEERAAAERNSQI